MKLPSKMTHTLAVGLCALAGCGQPDDGRVRVYPTRGTVMVDGEPSAGVEIVLYGNEDATRGPGMPAPAGVTDGAGGFRLRSFDPNDGAPAGEFVATAYWPEPLPDGADEEFYQRRDLLGGKYLEPGSSGLMLTVPEGGGELPLLELTTP